MIIPDTTITVISDKALLARQWDQTYADIHAGKTYSDACIDSDGWAVVKSASARFHPCCFKAEPKTILMVAENLQDAMKEKEALLSKGANVNEVYQNPDNHGRFDIYVTLDPKRTKEILERIPDPREWI